MNILKFRGINFLYGIASDLAGNSFKIKIICKGSYGVSLLSALLKIGFKKSFSSLYGCFKGNR